MRGSRAFVILTLYVLAMTAVATLVYLAFASAGGPGGANATAAADAGLAIFAAVVAVEVILVVFIGPAFTAGAISGERERQTFDLLRTTLLSAEAFVWGKLLSALSYVLLLIVASLPLLAIGFLLGGPSLTELLLSQALLVVAAVTYALFGLACSARLRTTLGATVSTLAGTLFLTFGVPVIALATIALFGAFGLGGTLGPAAERALLFGGLLLAATNLPATLIVSEVILTQENSLFLFDQVAGGTSIMLLSPWPVFILLHVAAAALLFVACVRQVRRVSDE
jgi:ABC-type transport system involved in multi-copper enzyme maturation permease subunit